MTERSRSPRFKSLIIPSSDPEQTAAWYSIAGITFDEEQHGKGPIHQSAELEAKKTLIEFYPEDTAIRIGFEVDSVEEVSNKYIEEGILPRHLAKESKYGKFITFKDPNGIIVEFREPPQS